MFTLKNYGETVKLRINIIFLEIEIRYSRWKMAIQRSLDWKPEENEGDEPGKK